LTMDFDLSPRDDFARQYGPWAVIAGGCEGVGAAFARAIATHKIKLFLIDQKPEPLVALSRSITAQHQVEVRAAPLDLAVSAGLEQIRMLTDSLEVGLFAFDAAYEGGRGPFVPSPLESAMQVIRRNVIATTALCHHYAAAMCRRGRGGVILIGSLEGCAGIADVATYCGSKAFSQIFCEGLWHELRPSGVDVLYCVAGSPGFAPVQGKLTQEQHQPPMDLGVVALEALDHLKDGPVWFAGDSKALAPLLCTPDRRAAAELMSRPASPARRLRYT
jgi:short-subunit dehydrogenase